MSRIEVGPDGWRDISVVLFVLVLVLVLVLDYVSKKSDRTSVY